MPNLIIEFESEELKDEFIGWLLDGGGEQEFDQDGETNFSYSPGMPDKITVTKPN